MVVVDTTTLPGTAGQLTNTTDPGVAGSPDAGNSQAPVNVTAGEIDLTVDFGYRDLTNPNTVTGTIWRDADADGTLDGTEGGRYAGVTVVLLDAQGDVVATTTTNGSGVYYLPRHSGRDVHGGRDGRGERAGRRVGTRWGRTASQRTR